MSNNSVNVLSFPKRKDIKDMTGEELAIEAERLETLAEGYSFTDWEAMKRVEIELRKVDELLLDKYNAENEHWLASHNEGLYV